MRRRDEAAKSRSLCWRRKRWSAKPVMTIFTAIKACAISSQRVAASGATCAIMSRRGRNDILPLAIAHHPQLTTDKSALPPLEKIALKSTPDWQAIWMERCVHDLPIQSLVSCGGMSVTRGTKTLTGQGQSGQPSPPRSRSGPLVGDEAIVLNELNTPGQHLSKRARHPQQPMAFGTRITHIGATAPAASRCWRRCAARRRA
jgi:hypothetical protein